jgi:sigma-B regulation protein RsbU (phosphoserine phosphatase)
MTLRQRVTAMIVIGLVAVVGLGGWLTYRFVQAADASTALLAQIQPAADAARTLATAYSEAEGAVSRGVLDAALVPAGQRAEAIKPAEDSYVQAVGLAQRSLLEITGSLPEDFEVQAATDTSLQDARTWQQEDANPVFTYLEQGNVAAAANVTRSLTAVNAYEAMQASANDLEQLIDARRTAAVNDYTALARKLAWALAITGLILLALLGAGLVALRRWVLQPLDDLRAQLRAAATPEGRYHPIEPSGPPELTATAQDAETMRRQLVAQIDAAVAATQGLTQQGPVVAAIRAELEASDDITIAGLTIAGSLQPAEGVLAGDWWDVMQLPDGRAAVLVTDVAGHGPAAGIGAVRVKSAIGIALASGIEPEAALSRAAAAFRDDDSQFATCALVIVDPRTGEVTWCNAGHPPPIIRRANGQSVLLVGTGPLISGLGGQWTTQTTALEHGDLLLAWSDGLVESHDANGDELGDDGLSQLIDSAVEANSAPAEVVERVLAAARERSTDWRRDDVTLVALARD